MRKITVTLGEDGKPVTTSGTSTPSNDTHRRMVGGYDITGREELFINNGSVNDASQMVTLVQDNGAKSTVHRAILVEWLNQKCVERLGTFRKSMFGEISENDLIERMAQMATIIVVTNDKYYTEPYFPAQRQVLKDSGYMYVPKQ